MKPRSYLGKFHVKPITGGEEILAEEGSYGAPLFMLLQDVFTTAAHYPELWLRLEFRLWWWTPTITMFRSPKGQWFCTRG